MNKVDVSKQIALNLGFKSGDVTKVLSDLVRVVEKGLLAGEVIRLGFVTLKTRKASAMVRRNPKTGAKVPCPAHMEVRAKIAPSLKAAVKGAKTPNPKKKTL